MEKMHACWAWCQQSGLMDADLSVPLFETVVLFFILTLCLLFRYSRTGLLVAYLFVYRWGWRVQAEQFFADDRARTFFHGGYVIFGILVFTCAIVGMVYAAHRHD